MNNITEVVELQREEIVALQAEADRLRAILRRCMPGTFSVDLGRGEVIGLHLRSTVNRG